MSSEINLNPPEESLGARHLTALIGLWLEALDVTEITRTTYRDKIRHFVDWWEATGPTVNDELTQSLLIAFEVSLRGIITQRFNQPLSYQSRHAIIRAVRMMFKWASATKRTMRNFGEWVPWPNGGTPLRRSATLTHLADLMFAAGESRQPLRDQALLAFFIGTGCRRGEVASMTVENLQMLADGSGTAIVDGKHTKANEVGVRAVGFDAAAGRYLIRYMDEMVIVSGPLWIGDEGAPLQAAGIYQMVKRAIKRAGLGEHIRGCHDLRRAFATILGLMYPNSPAWADMIRRQLGHKHYSMTAHYTLLDVDDLRDNLTSPLTLIDRGQQPI